MFGLRVFIVFVISSSICFNEVSAAPESVVTESQESLCGEDRIFSPCFNNPCVRIYCEKEPSSSDCKIQEEYCEPGCVCKKGYLLAKNDTCVPENLCTNSITCREDEEFSNCINGGCSKRTCKEVDFPIICINIISEACVSGCVCKDGYLRTENETCVPVNNCPENEVCSGPHKFYDPCPPSCSARVCEFSDNPTTCPPESQSENHNCYPGCECEEGFYKNLKRDCVPFEDCPKYCFGNNESPVSYPETCVEETCDSINSTENLQRSTNITCNIYRCVPGYVRNKHGECIKKENCGKCQGPNEYFGCSSPCDTVCDTLDMWNRTNCTTHPNWEYCVDMCYCDDGYARDSNNICIPIADCPTSVSGDNSDTKNKLD